MSDTPPTTGSAADLTPYVEALRKAWSALPDFELQTAARIVLGTHSERSGHADDFAPLYKALLRRHRSAAQFRVEAIREALDQIERDLKDGRAPAYQAGAIATDVIHLGERLAALETLNEFTELFTGAGNHR